MESLNSLLAESESKASKATTSSNSLMGQLTEIQENLNEETRQKLDLNSKLRAMEAEKDQIQEQLEEEEQAKSNAMRQVSTLQMQVRITSFSLYIVLLIFCSVYLRILLSENTYLLIDWFIYLSFSQYIYSFVFLCISVGPTCLCVCLCVPIYSYLYINISLFVFPSTYFV